MEDSTLENITLVLIFSFVAWGIIGIILNLLIPVSSEIECINFDKPIYQHIHVNVSGIDIPAGVGLEDNCFREMHTHWPDGILHLESNEPKNFTLADFFEVWNITINGKPADLNTVLKDQDNIYIGRSN